MNLFIMFIYHGNILFWFERAGLFLWTYLLPERFAYKPEDAEAMSHLEGGINKHHLRTYASI